MVKRLEGLLRLTFDFPQLALVVSLEVEASRTVKATVELVLSSLHSPGESQTDSS